MRAGPALARRMAAWRHHLHAHPEPSLHEAETARFVGAALEELGVPFVAGVGGHGVVATLARGGHRSVGLRADMDALPITETSGLPYASTRPGVMHACGHDGHMASLLGAAALLAADRGWSGTVHLVFQPAEEGFGGARAMLEDGLLQRFPAERLFGYHNWPGLPAGTVAVHDGPVMAAGGRLTLTVEGHAGHAAMPHLTRDPLLAAAHLLIALQSLVSRNVDPQDAAVVSVGVMEGGVAYNQIPGRAVLRGTVRTQRAEVWDLVEAGVIRIAAGVAQALGVVVEPVIRRTVPVTANTGTEAALARAAAGAMGAAVRRDMAPSMASEDFGFYLEQVPGAFVWIGNGPVRPGGELHGPAYDYNDAILPVAAEYLAGVAKLALAG